MAEVEGILVLTVSTENVVVASADPEPSQDISSKHFPVTAKLLL